jgi:hypothetical protein
MSTDAQRRGVAMESYENATKREEGGDGIYNSLS